MKIKCIVFIIFCFFLIISCKDDTYTLEKDSPAYQLAINLMKKLPIFNPDTSVILVSTDKFKLTNREFIQNVSDKFGSNADRLTGMPVQQLQDIIPRMAHDMAIDKLLLTVVDEHGIKVSEEKVDSLLNTQFDRAGGRENFLQQMERNGNSLTEIRKNIYNYLVVNEYLKNYLFQDIVIPEDKIQEIYQSDITATVRHILLMTRGKSEQEKIEIRKKMENILQRAKKGESFTSLVKKYSEDPGSKDKGGLYENFPRGQMVKSFEDAAFSVPVGHLSDIVETNYGYHILKIIDRQQETRPLNEVRKEIEQKIKKEQEKKLYKEHIEALKEKYNFTIMQI